MRILKFAIPLLILLGVVGVFANTYIQKSRRLSEIREAFALKNIERTYLHMDQYFPIKEMEASSQPFIFPQKENTSLVQSFSWEGQTLNVQKFIDSSYTQGLLIIQHDTLIYEFYDRGQKENTPHISWSMAKSFVSALFGIAIEEGYIKSIEQTVDEYLPELKGSGYEGVSIKDVLQMSTGVRFDETYSDLKSDINRWWQSFVLGESQDQFAATLEREDEPGTYNHYVSINTHVLGMILVKATGKSLTEYLREKIWHPMGAEFGAYWLSDKEGMEMALGGLNACLRDYAKLGQLFLHQGNWQGEQIVPKKWIEMSMNPDAEHLQASSENSAHPGIAYGFQWWIPDGKQGEFLAIGVFNQFIYVNPSTQTVIVKNSANRNYYNRLNNPYASKFAHIALFRALANQSSNINF